MVPHSRRMISRRRTAELLQPHRIGDRPSKWVNRIIITLIVLSVIAVGLESLPSIYRAWYRELWWFEILSVSVFTLEYLARLWSCVELPEYREMRPWKARLHYVFTPLALIDLLAILPFYLSFHLDFDLRFLRILRLLRMLKIARYSPAMNALLDVLRKEADALLAAVVVLVMMLVIAAAGIHLLEAEAQPEVFGSIPESLWWAIVTLTTVGYGDVVPVTTGGKIFGGIISLIGIGMVALPAAILASGFAANLRQRQQRYANFIKRALADGRFNEEERWKLEELRKELGLTREESVHLLDMILRQVQVPETCPHCGKRLRPLPPRETTDREPQ